MEFTTSSKEIIRRKKAFISLCVSLFLSMMIFSKLLSTPIPIGIYIMLIVVFIFLSVITLKFFDKLLNTKLTITNTYITKTIQSAKFEYLLKDIASIKVKRRTNKQIREISVYFKNHKNIYISAYEEVFDKLYQALKNSLDKSVRIKETKEPIEYDNIFFYPVLGIIIGFSSVFCFGKLILASYSTLKILFTMFSIYTFALGIYFLLKKPITASVGKSQTVIDFMFGIGLILASIAIVFMLYSKFNIEY